MPRFTRKKQAFAMHRTPIADLHLSLRLGRAALTFGASWLVVVPASLWAIATVYVPIMGSFSGRGEVWFVAAIIGLLSAASLMAHAAAHLGMARLVGGEVPADMPLYPFGDAAQVWPAARTPWREAQVALAGPLVNGLLVALSYLLWNAQLSPYVNVSTLFLAFFNGGLVVANLIPAFPLDGGRLLRAIGWGFLLRPAPATRLALRMGFLFSLFLIGWAIFLCAQWTRYSLLTGGITLAFAGLILVPLRMQPAWAWDRPLPFVPPQAAPGRLRALVAGLLLLGMLGIALGLVPTNSGLEIPGVAPAVAPMVELPPEYAHPFAGSFILTTVVQQTPILAGQWLFGRLSPMARIVPPERVLPPDTTIQEIAERNFRLLEESEMTAVAVGLRLAGYDARMNGKGVRVVEILPDSPAGGVLQPGDIIVGIDGEPVAISAELINALWTKDPQAMVTLQVERDGGRQDVVVPLMPPVQEDQPPRIGIVLEPAGFEIDLPFPVRIVPQKIVGGPSAGLLFTLTVYNLVTPEDLTGGRTIAGTGTIELDGTVGPIGGVQQKVAGAEFAGAEIFLSPPENYADARAAARRIRVVEVATAEEAIQFLRSLPPVSEQP